MTAIYKRELKTFFTTVTGWLFIAAHICLAGLYFFAINLLSGYSNVGQSFSSILFLLLLSTPILSMRMLAEERKQKTDQLILTSPVSIGGIVAGKYLAMATVFTIPVAVMALFPLILSRYGTVPMGESYTALLAYYLFGLTCLAIGLFISSITESQIIAAVLSFALLFVGYMMSSITGLISQTGNLLTKIFKRLQLHRPSGRYGGGNAESEIRPVFCNFDHCIFILNGSVDPEEKISGLGKNAADRRLQQWYDRPCRSDCGVLKPRIFRPAGSLYED